MSTTNSLNTITVTGNLCRDPELSYLPSGTALAKTSIAINHYKKKGDGEWEQETSFINLTAFAHAAEKLTERAKKGQRITVWGEFRCVPYTNKDGERRSTPEISVQGFQGVEFLDGNGGGDAPRSRPQQGGPKPMPSAPPVSDIDDEEIPF